MRLPPGNSRVAFIGPTRCGKTYVARAWLKYYPHVIVIDPKRQWDWREPGIKRYSLVARDWHTFKNYLAITADKKSPEYSWPIVWQPPPDQLSPEDLDQVYEIAFHRGHTLVYMDELYFLSDASTGGSRTKWFRACVTAGASNGVGVWSAFQRPAWVPLIAMTETEVRVIFFLRNDGDRKKIDDSFTSKEEPVPWNDLKPLPHSKFKFVISTDAWLSRPTRIKLEE